MNQEELKQLINQAKADGRTKLDLSNKGVTDLPPEIGQLTNLTRLYVNNNQLTTVPPEIGQLSNLTSLDLNDNSLIAVPPEIGQLSNLILLELAGNKLTTVPSKIGQLSSLTLLDLSDNSLTAAPSEIGQLSKLAFLRLSENKLTTIPPEIGQLSKLTSLELGSNQITAVPPEISQLTNLTSLDLSNNQLTAVPPEIGQLSKLATLTLFNNRLTAIPPDIGQLFNLTSIDISDNLLTAVPPEIGQIINLTILNFRNNKIMAIPPEIGQLHELTSLDLGHNQLTNVPSEIGQLTNLTTLVLKNNKLAHLPKKLQKLTQLKTLDLRGNSALGISPEVLEQTDNPALILKTYFGKRKPLYEAKMLLVGQGGVGKTALARRLLFDLPPDEKQGKTAGVDIQKWSIKPTGTTVPVTLNLWDFGGQGVYQATHQFFFTRRSLYLIVINARTGEQESRLHHWLKLVESLSNQAPVIIVVNKQDEHALNLDERELRYKYPNLLQVIPTSCVTGEGIPQLRTAIKAALTQLPHINDQFPIAWFNLKTQLEQMDSNYITYERYTEYCESVGIKNKADQRSWVQVLHHLGVVLNYQDDNYRQLAGTHVLKPEWVTDGVYRILSDPNSQIAKNNGVLTAAMLDNILDPDVYPRHQQHFIVEMMRKFELSFRIPHRPDQYLIPDLLPKERPQQSILPPEASRLRFQIHYSDFLPGSILSRFMVGMMAALDRNASWRNGAVLKFEANNALVLADLEARKIFISISGNETTRRGLLNSIRMQLHAIHSTFPNLTLTEHVPIPEHPGKTIDYEELLWYESENDLQPRFAPVRGRIDVKALLDGIETPALRRERQLQEQLKTQSLEEIMQLCFVLAVDYEDLLGQTKSAKTRELVQFMGRNGRLDELAGQIGRSY